MHVEDDVAVVSNDTFTPHSIAAKLVERVLNKGARHWNNFDWERKRAELRDHFAVIGDANELLRFRSSNLLAGQRRAAAFNQKALVRRFIGAVDVDVDPINVVEVLYVKTEFTQQLG